MKTIFSKVKLRPGQIVQLFLLVLLSAVGQMLLPSFLAQMISHGVAEGENRIVWMYAVIMAGVTLFSCVISFLSVKIASYISTDFAAQLRTQVFSKVQEFSAAEMDRFGTASLVTRSTSDITNVQNFLTLLLRVGLLAPMMAAAGLVFSAATGGEVSSVLLVAIPVLLTVLTIIMVLASKYLIRLRKKLDQINRLFLESLEGVRVIRAFNKQKTENARFEEANEDYAMTAMAAGRIKSLLMPAISVIFGVTTAAVLGMGAYYVSTGAMEVGSLVANSQYISMVLTSVMMLSLVIMMFPTSYACAKRIAEVLQTDSSIRGGKFQMENRPVRGTVEFRHMTFAYPGADEPILKDISFESRSGEVTAISPITTLVNDLGYVLCAALGCLWAIAGKIAVGNVQAMLEYTWRFAEPFSAIAGMVGSFGAAAAAGNRIFGLLDAEEEIPDSDQCIVPDDRSGRVTFENVTFGYTPDHLLMNGIDLTVEPGQKVAVVGPTGAGKTTLINLLMRFYEVNNGSIKVDGTKITDMPREELRDRFGMVLQDTWLFEGTIGENIGYAEDNMKKEKIVEAAKSACAHSFIKTLPGGYDMTLSKGAENISQGERQLLTIARAIASDPEIMILDEATSNVDTHTEVLIQKAMAELMKGRTSFVIAHRLSTIRDADMILYMEDGDIKEVGNHEELMKKNGKYAALYMSQFA